MSEEIRNRNNELSDAALEQVSGGANARSIVQARRVCAECPAHNGTLPPDYCEGGEAMLAEFIEGKGSSCFIENWTECSFFKLNRT